MKGLVQGAVREPEGYRLKPVPVRSHFQQPLKRAARAAYWAAPSLICLAIYWLGLRAWFQQDDFAWLGLNKRLQETGNLWALLFEPQAQGTIRPLSERAFFLAFNAIFGFDALPFRIAVFLTQIANLLLVSSVAWRLTKSRVAGFLAPVLWICNSALGTVMSWTSAYNQALCAFFLLVSFRSLLLYIDTGKRRYLVMQWVTFLLGFGALEINVVYPGIAAAYTFVASRKHFRSTLWLFLPSIAYAAAHWYFAPMPTAGPYLMYFDGSLFESLTKYWAWAMGPERLGLVSISLPVWLVRAVRTLLTLGILGFVFLQLRKRNGVPLFLLLWFLLLLAPVLPLRDHRFDYYLTTPTLGLAVLGAWGLAEAWKGKWLARIVAVTLAAVYLASSVPFARAMTRYNYQQSRASRGLVQGLIRAHELHPTKLILLSGVSTDLFWSTIYHKVPWLTGVPDVYLTPGSELAIGAYPDLDSVSEYVLPAALAVKALEEDRAMVYSPDGDRLRNVTAVFQATARARWGDAGLPFRIDPGNPLFEAQLGPTWYSIHGAYRWMPKRATVNLHGPSEPGAMLYLSGFVAKGLVAQRPVEVSVCVDGIPIGHSTLSMPDALFSLSFPMPAQSVGKAKVEVGIEVDHTFAMPPDMRQLGLVFGAISIR